MWLPAIIATLMIAGESTNTFSSQNTNGPLRWLFESIFGVMSVEFWTQVHFLMRKTGHFIGFGLVCLMYLRAWLLALASRTSYSWGEWRLRAVLAAIGSTFLVASADEIHQTFLPSRTGAFTDVLLDTTGGTIMCLFLWLVFWKRKKWAAPR
jgi:VanZ family protein